MEISLVMTNLKKKTIIQASAKIHENCFEINILLHWNNLLM